MDKQFVEKFKLQLLDLQSELKEISATGKEASGTVELDQSRLGRLSRMDALQGQAMSQAINQRRDLELKKISAALQRIESDDYGYCVKCDEAIAIKRLELDPAAPLCIDCAEAAESK
ncbi:MAG: TraR/DksA family transcriptional regulator [Gammaproteobacteria bacterium]|nr:TraR/DksA family transcriptional regulator [Gammaproteobacteria bacterium]